MNLKLRTKIVLIAFASMLLAIGAHAPTSSIIMRREYSEAFQDKTLIISLPMSALPWISKACSKSYRPNWLTRSACRALSCG